MWLFLSARLRRWLFVTVALPVVARLARHGAAWLERRHGSTVVSRGLGTVGGLAGRPASGRRSRTGRRTRRGPWSRR